MSFSSARQRNEPVYGTTAEQVTFPAIILPFTCAQVMPNDSLQSYSKRQHRFPAISCNLGDEIALSYRHEENESQHLAFASEIRVLGCAQRMQNLSVCCATVSRCETHDALWFDCSA